MIVYKWFTTSMKIRYITAITHPVSANLIPSEAAVPGGRAEKEATVKKRHHTNLCAQNGIVFFAAAIETGGRFCEDFRSNLENLFSPIFQRNRILFKLSVNTESNASLFGHSAPTYTILKRQYCLQKAITNSTTDHHGIISEDVSSEVSPDIF